MMRRTVSLLSLVVGLGAAAVGIGAQQASARAGTDRPDYSKEASIIEDFRTTVSFEDDGTGTRENIARVRVQSEAGVQQYGLLIFGYDAANEQLAVDYVRVLKPDGSVITTPPEDERDMPSEITRQAPIYSDHREMHIAVKGLAAGDVLEYKFRSRLQTALVAGQFWFVSDFFKNDIVLNQELRVSIPKDRYVNVKSSEVKPVVTEEAGRRLYWWKTANLERQSQKEEPSADVPPPAVEISTFRSWEEVGRWWGALEQERAAPTPDVRAKASELTKNAKTDAEKLRTLYKYVATQFRYVGVSFGMGRYQPHAADEVLKNGFGDCKDKHTLLASLAQAQGWEVYPALINTARKIDPDVPSPAQFDHVISVAPQGEDRVWLDTTTEVAPFGFLTLNLRDKQALVIPHGKTPLLVNTPANPPFEFSQLFEADGKLANDGAFESQMGLTARGDVEVLLRTLFRHVPQTQWKDLVQGISNLSGFGGTVSDVTAGAPEATDVPFRYSYKYSKKDFSDWANKRIAPAIPPLGLPVLDETKKSTNPVRLGAPGEVIFKSRILMPSGYTTESRPPLDIVNDFAEYHATYTFKEGALLAERRLVIKESEIPAAHRHHYAEFQKAVSADENEYIVLRTGPATASNLSGNAEADKLILQGREAFGRGDLQATLDYFQRAVKLEPQFRNGWLGVATIAMQLRRNEEGLAAFHKAIDLDPNEPQTYKMLAFALMALNRKEEAIQVWRDLLKINPNEKDAHANLGNILLDLNRGSEAVAELTNALELNPQSGWLQQRLGEAYLKTGDRGKAVAAAKKAVELDPHPLTWNNIAYFLADNGLDLADAESYAQQAVKEEEEYSSKISVDKISAADLDSMRSLSAFWDTLGWVYFRQGKLEKAENYLRAAFALRQDGSIAEHIAQVCEKQGKKEAANKARIWAAALDHRREAESRPGPRTPGDAAREELSQMRRTKLGRISTKTGSAEFFVLLAPGPKIEEVKSISGSEDLQPVGSKAIASIKFDPVYFPQGSIAKLLRRGVLVCGVTFGCDFTLFNVDGVHSTN